MSATLYFANVSSKVQDSIVRAYQKAYGEVWANPKNSNGPSQESLERYSHFEIPRANFQFTLPLVSSFTTRKGADYSGFSMNTVTKAGVHFQTTPPYVVNRIPETNPHFGEDEIVAQALAEEDLGIVNINRFMDLVHAVTPQPENPRIREIPVHDTSDRALNAYAQQAKEAVQAYEPYLIKEAG